MRSIDLSHELTWPKALLFAPDYAVLYLILDDLSFIHDLQHTEISQWGPQIELLCAMVMYFGPRAAPLTILVPGISEVILRDAVSDSYVPDFFMERLEITTGNQLSTGYFPRLSLAAWQRFPSKGGFIVEFDVRDPSRAVVDGDWIAPEITERD